MYDGAFYHIGSFSVFFFFFFLSVGLGIIMIINHIIIWIIVH